MTPPLSDLEIHDKRPEKFVPQVEVAACYLEMDGKILLLERRKTKSEPGKWGVPAGKLEQNETPAEAAKRELFEETGIDIEIVHLTYIPTLYIQKLGYNFIFHPFKVDLPLHQIPEVQLSSEHENYKWATPEDMKNMPLIAGAWEAFQRYKAAFQKNVKA